MRGTRLFNTLFFEACLIGLPPIQRTNSLGGELTPQGHGRKVFLMSKLWRKLMEMANSKSIIFFVAIKWPSQHLEE